MLTTMFWSVLLRTGQIAIESSSTLVVGLFVAAVMRQMLGADGTRKLFGGESFKGLVRAWIIGSLLPVCSLGVIPVAREMRRAGVPSATVLAFILAAPQLNPLSFLYGLTLSEPIVILCFVAATMVVAVAGGELWKWKFETAADTLPPGDEPLPPPGVKRLLSVAVAAGREAVGPTMAYALCGIAFTGLLAGLLPHGCLSLSMRHDDWTSPAMMTLIGVPAYSGVLPGMMRIGLMFEHGNSVGAAFVLYALGIGTNLGLMFWLVGQFGRRRAPVWFACVIGMVVALGYAMESPLYFAREEASHTHAFDEWTSPFVGSGGADWDNVRKKLSQKVEVLEPVALFSLAALALLGWLVQRCDRAGRLDSWLTQAPPPTAEPASIWDRHLPGPVLGFAVLLGLVAFSVAALFIYYPDADQAFSEIGRVRADALSAVRSGNKEDAIRQLQHWDLLTRKVQVGIFIRTGALDPDHAKLAEDLRERLEEMRDALLADNLDEAKNLIPLAEAAHRQVRDAYLPHGLGAAASVDP